MNRLTFLDVRGRTRRAARALKESPAIVRRRLSAAEVWVQDHAVGLGITAVVLILTAAGLLLRFRPDQVIEQAKLLAPVFTILSIVISAVFGFIKWVRKRRRARLATTEAARL
ncbi:hypothetical protein AB0957_36360 [Streptomyces zhihengii]|uniref:hypothetical protein n=1 Tax=Streptomyces zhihengii TaxID=1818004 RepID=UPI003454502E